MCLNLPGLWSPTSPALGTAASMWSGPSLSSSTTGWTGQRIQIKINQGHHWWWVMCNVQVQHLHKDETGRGLGSEGGDCASCDKTQCGKGKRYYCLSTKVWIEICRVSIPPDKTIYSTNTSMYKIVFMRLFCFPFSSSLSIMSLSKDKCCCSR